MRFELTLTSDGKVDIVDKYNARKTRTVANTDYAIRKGIKEFYQLDVASELFTSAERKDYIKKMMNRLPKEDLHFE